MKLSIIIPVYNTREYLGKCLDSVIYPGLSDYEIIVVNDGSTDDSADIASDYAARFPSMLRLITTENGGLGHARNAGMAEASGDFVFFLDSDDFLAPGAVAEMLEMTGQGYDICLCDIQSVAPSGKPLERMNGCGRTGPVSLDSYPELLLAYPSGCNKLCRRSLFTDTGLRFPDRAWYEDLRTMPKLYLHTDKIISTGRLWYMYLCRPGSIINSAGIERSLEIIDAVDDLTGYYRAHGRYDRYRREFEYQSFYNQFLASSVHICAAQPASPILDTLRQDFLNKYPDYKVNPYVLRMPFKHKLLSGLLLRRRYRWVRLIMKLSNMLKGK